MSKAWRELALVDLRRVKYAGDNIQPEESRDELGSLRFSELRSPTAVIIMTEPGEFGIVDPSVGGYPAGSIAIDRIVSADVRDPSRLSPFDDPTVRVADWLSQLRSLDLFVIWRLVCADEGRYGLMFQWTPSEATPGSLGLRLAGVAKLDETPWIS